MVEVSRREIAAFACHPPSQQGLGPPRCSGEEVSSDCTCFMAGIARSHEPPADSLIHGMDEMCW